MAKQSVVEKIEEFAISACEELGLLLYNIDYKAGGKAVAVYIDRADSQAVSLEDCEKVSHALGELLDEHDPIPGENYTLEVSSPGIERELSKNWHYQKAMGGKIEVKLFETMGVLFPEVTKKYQRSKVVQGVLKEANEENLLLDIEGADFRLTLEKVVKSKIVFEF